MVLPLRLTGLLYMGSVAIAVFTQIYLEWLPCVLCVEIRAWMLAAGILLFLASFLPGSKGRRATGLLGTFCALGAGWSSYQLFSLEQGWVESLSCSPFARFPSWLPLQDWLPVLFQPQAICGESVKAFVLPLSAWPMVFALLACYATYSVFGRNRF